MDILRIAGTHREAGRAHGESLRENVRESLDLRMALCEAGKQAPTRKSIKAVAHACLGYLGEYSPGLLNEAQGMAEGSGVTPEDIVIVSGFTDLKDMLIYGPNEAVECTACWAGPNATPDGSAFVAQTWDMFADAEAGMVWAHLAIDNEPEVFCLTYGGCVGMMGMNEHGVAVAANNLGPTDALPGVPWTFVCRAMLTCRTADGAEAELRRARLCSGHHFLIGDASGAMKSIETTGTSIALIRVAESTYAHTNHYLDSELKRVEKEADPKGCSPHRLERMTGILREGGGRIDSALLQGALRDHVGKPRSICSHDYEISSGMKIRSCGALVMNTVSKELDYVTGNPCTGEFARFTFAPPARSSSRTSEG